MVVRRVHLTMTNNQVKSRKRVVDHGEVFTSEREVNSMLDLVKEETERIESRFLEPTCGTGNFLIKILQRKLKVVESRYSNDQKNYERYAFLAVSSIYGVDLLEDNVTECRTRLFKELERSYLKKFKKKSDTQYLKVIHYLLSKNILYGNALTMKTNSDEPIIFSEWSLVSGDMVKRRDYRFDELLEVQQKQMSLFTIDWEYDKEQNIFIPLPVQEFPLTNLRRICNGK